MTGGGRAARRRLVVVRERRDGLPGGGWVAAGEATVYGGRQSGMAVVRGTSGAAPKASWRSLVTVDRGVLANDVTALPGGRIVAVGQATPAERGGLVFATARLRANGVARPHVRPGRDRHGRLGPVPVGARDDRRRAARRADRDGGDRLHGRHGRHGVPRRLRGPARRPPAAGAGAAGGAAVRRPPGACRARGSPLGGITVRVRTPGEGPPRRRPQRRPAATGAPRASALDRLTRAARPALRPAAAAAVRAGRGADQGRPADRARPVDGPGGRPAQRRDPCDAALSASVHRQCAAPRSSRPSARPPRTPRSSSGWSTRAWTSPA